MAMRVINNGKSEGGMAMAYLVSIGAAITTGSLVKGTFYYVKSKASAASGLPANIAVGLPFQAATAIALAEGDEVYPLTMKPLGFARDKSIDASKNQVDTTTDIDYPNSSSMNEEAITRTGSVSGYLMLDAKDSAMMKFMAQFQNLVYADDDGVTVTAPSSEIVLLAFDWLAKTYGKAGPAEGDARHVEFLPVTLSNTSKSASKGSAVTLSFNYNGQPKTEEGLEGATYIGPHYAPVA